MTNKFKLPQGVLDYLPEECYSKTLIENKLIGCFKDYGYRQIDTPILERYDLFESGIGKVSLKKLFKVTDIDGDLLVLRPDMTVPISRINCTKLPEGQYKFCYQGKVFSMIEESGKLREFTQIGVEVLGAKGNGVDIEIVMLAIKSMLETGLKDFQIELGHVGFFKGLIKSMNLNDEQVNELVELVEKKDSIGEQVFAKKVGLDKKSLDLLLKLPMLFGSVEILDEAFSMCVNEEMAAAINNLKTIYKGVKAMGYDKYISFDLSVVGKMNYYSGMVFKGITKSYGRPFLIGGRYDNLCDSFGKHVPCVGFAAYMGYLQTILSIQKKLPKPNSVDIVIGFEFDQMKIAEKLFDEYKANGVNAVKSFATTIEQLEKCMVSCNAKKGIFVTKDSILEV